LVGGAADLLDVNSSWAQALQLLTQFYAAPAQADPEATLAATSIPPFNINWFLYSDKEIRSKKRSII
jgi:hypothetical protein